MAIHTEIPDTEKFSYRHNAHQDLPLMLQTVGAQTLDQLIEETIPAAIRLQSPLELPDAMTEAECLAHMREMLNKNKVFKSFIGAGYYGCHTPTVIQRNILENPGWYTAYTPYQAEIAQGRLEALMNYQTVVADLTGLPIANASLLDEATAAAEAMAMTYAVRKTEKQDAKVFFVDENVFPQVVDVLATRANALGLQVKVAPLEAFDQYEPHCFAAYLQNPGKDGGVQDYSKWIAHLHARHTWAVMGVDLMSLLLMKSPGEMGADVAVGNSQRFGVPIGFGGPHAAFFATREAFKRQLPGRIIGQSIDAEGNSAYRMALQTREQHIRREKATSNICTAQVLLAVMAGMYAVYHGPQGLKNIATRIHGLACAFAEGLKRMNISCAREFFFDTVCFSLQDASQLRLLAEAGGYNLQYPCPNQVSVSFDETSTQADLEQLLQWVATASKKQASTTPLSDLQALPLELKRESPYLTHPVFSSYQSEHEMLRYIKRLENKDLSMAHSMISLGSCTMKLNATTEMIPLSWASVGQLHPFAPAEQTQGYTELIARLSKALQQITRFTAVSFQPNSGAQGEYAGLLCIRAYHRSRKEENRNIALIPASAHGTNPASAVMAGMKVVVVKSDAEGKIDVEDLKQKVQEHAQNLSCLIVTYPSTHGVYEEAIQEICALVHAHGGLVYMDGANMNAQVGLTSPATIGADVCHLNLHKTFAIPHGGGGPGVGPICVNDKLKDFLPRHSLAKTNGKESPVSAAPWGSASVLTISYAYIAMMGAEGLTQAAKIAILNANYIKDKLKGSFETLYTGKNGRCAHEFIADCRAFKAHGVEVEDIAKRLMDYGFHAPTVSFPVPGTLMIEPTESETRDEIDRFISAMKQIRAEIRAIENGTADKSNNVLKNAPHTASVVTADNWDRPYGRQQAAYPLPYLKVNKFWPSVSRIDGAYGDRNLICTCLPMEAYAKA